MKENIKTCIPLIICLSIIFLFLFLNTHDFNREIPVEKTEVLNNVETNQKGNILSILSYDDFLKTISSSEYKYIIFGKTNCPYCRDYLNVLNTISAENNITFYYINLLSVASDEASKIRNSDLLIPSKCSKTGQEEKLNISFGTPLTILTKDGKAVDCVNGYKNYDYTISFLKSYALIK